MENADVGPAVPVPVSGRKKKRACQRCRQRKQKCDLAEPCPNCVTAGVDCNPVPQEAFESYPVGYVSALEQHAAILERSLNESFPGSAPDHLNRNESRGSISELHHNSLTLGQSTLSPISSNHQLPRTMENSYQDFNMNGIPQNGRSFDFAAHSSPNPTTSPVLVTASHISPPEMSQHTVSSEKFIDEAEDVPTVTAASFFRTYFQFIHPQYPFLSVRQCTDWYLAWKLAKQSNEEFTGWPAFFVKLIFSIGSLIQSKSDEAPRYQHHGLKSQVQNEDAILQDSKSSVLIRFQAMLMLAMHALHSDSTARIAYITGATMRFAALHKFHRLLGDGSDDSMMKTRVWSCAYVLDRAVSATLDIPVSLAEAYISTTLFSEGFQSEAPQVWLQDCSASTIPDLPQSLSTFSHICKIRYIQSYILYTLHTSTSPTAPDPDWQANIHAQISSWASSINQYSLPSSQGYQSPLWLSLIGQLSRLIIYRPTRSTASTTIGDVALRASCDACTTFRELQKKRQIAQPWLAVLTQFQAGVTIYYVAYRRASPLPKDADFAVRDCTSVLAILADRWRTAEHYRDCFELLVRMFSPAEGGSLSGVGAAPRELLSVLVGRVLESGVHEHVADMLREFCEDGKDGAEDNLVGMIG